MLNKIRTVVIFFIFQTCVLVSQTVLNKDEKVFIQEHRLPNSVISKLDKVFSSLDQNLKNFIDGQDVNMNRRDITSLFEKTGFEVYKVRSPFWGHRVARVVAVHKTVPNFFLKIGFDHSLPRASLSRIIIADFLNDLGQTHHLLKLNLGIIKKKLYHRPAKPHDLTDFNYIVVSPKINGIPLAKQKRRGGSKYTNEWCKKFFEKFIKSSGFRFIKSIMGTAWDHYAYNLVFGLDGKLYYIDTDPLHEHLLNLDSFANKLIKHILGV